MLRPAQLTDLALMLRQHDFVISTHQTLAAARLLAQLPGPVAEADLGYWLAPVFCSTARQQRDFPKIVAAWARIALAPPMEAVPQKNEGEGSRSQKQEIVLDAPSWNVWMATVIRRHYAVLLGMAALIVAGGAVAAYLHWWPADEARNPRTGDAVGSHSVLGGTVAPARALSPVAPLAGLRAALPAALLAAAGVPLLAWLVMALRRRGFLERQPDKRELLALHLQGGHAAAMKSWRADLRFLGRALRRRVTQPSPELDVPATVAHYVRTGMLSRLYFGSRHEPEYLVLIDCAGVVDHFARIAEELVGALHDDTGVNVQVFVFQGDPRLLRYQPLQPGREGEAYAAELDSLPGRFPQSRLLVFSDGHELISPMSGRPVAWLPTLLQWPNAALITPRPRAQWSVREDMLLKAGLDVVPLDSTGLVLLGELLTAQHGMRTCAAHGDMRPAPPYLRDVAGLLDSVTPGEAEAEALVGALRRDLGPRGFVWLCACAVYPEIQWGLTLRLGQALLPVETERAQLLVGLSALPWLRRGYMPDWLRERLLAAFDARDADLAREAVDDYLATVAAAGRAAAGIDQLRIAHAAARGFWSDVRAGLVAHLGRRSAPPIREDGVYLRFMSCKPSNLAVSAGDRIAQLFQQHGSALGRPRTLPYLLASSVLAGAAIPGLYGGTSGKDEFVTRGHGVALPAVPAATEDAATRVRTMASNEYKAPAALAAPTQVTRSASAVPGRSRLVAPGPSRPEVESGPATSTLTGPYAQVERDARGAAPTMSVQDGRAAASDAAARAMADNARREAAENAGSASADAATDAAFATDSGANSIPEPVPPADKDAGNGQAGGIQQISPLFKVRFTATPTGQLTRYGPEFTYRFWLSEPTERFAQIREVVYSMDDPTFKQKQYRSEDAGSGFAQSYKGWGCLSTVGVTVNYRNKRTERFDVSMCAALNKPDGAVGVAPGDEPATRAKALPNDTARN